MSCRVTELLKFVTLDLEQILSKLLDNQQLSIRVNLGDTEPSGARTLSDAIKLVDLLRCGVAIEEETQVFLSVQDGSDFVNLAIPFTSWKKFAETYSQTTA